MKPSFRYIAGICACALSVSADVGYAGHQFTETFTSTTYKDAVNTTADWNTGGGTLQLFPFSTTVVGECTMTGQRMAVQGDFAFVADAASGLRIINISNPSHPTLVGTYDTPGSAYDVAVAGNLAFVADMSSGLTIIDITNPMNPTLVGTRDTPGDAFGVAVAGDLAFVADFTSGLQVINVSNPANPTIVGTYNTAGNARDIAVAGDLAFVADDGPGLIVINIKNPASPSFVGSYNTSGFALSVAVAGDLAFVADGFSGSSDGLKIIDITNPANPALVGTFSTLNGAFDVSVIGDRAFVVWGYGLDIINIVNPTTPTLVSRYSQAMSSIAVSGEFAFAMVVASLPNNDESRFRIIRISDRATPTLVGSSNTPGIAQAVAVDGDLAFIGDGDTGLQIVSIANPASPTLIGTRDTPGSVNGIAVDGNLVLAADGLSGLANIDITNPASPTIVGAYNTPGNANGVDVAGDLAFVADGLSGLQVIDIVNPAIPTFAGAYNTVGNANGVDVAGDLAFVADGSSGLQIINVVNPATPTLVGAYDTPGSANGVASAGNVVLVADGSSGLQVFDVTNPASPTHVGSYDTPGNALGVAMVGDLAAIADEYGGLQLFDITIPSAPTPVGSLDTPGYAYGVVLIDEIAFVADYGAGLEAIQILQHEVDVTRNVGSSLAIDGSSSTIRRVRLTTTQTAGVDWEVSGNNGINWQAIAPDNSWGALAVAGADLRWRSSHRWAGGNPTVSDLHLEWLFEHAEIAAITDIAGDQGGWVRASFVRSGHDFQDDASPVTNYGIWRRVEDTVLLTREHSPQSLAQVGQDILDIYGGLPLLVQGNRVFVHSATASTAAVFPPGTWELVQTVPALQHDTYLVAVPTQTNGIANPTVLAVTAHTPTPSIWYVSAADSGYSSDNLPPSVPANLTVAYNSGGGNVLTWSPSPDGDFQNFRVYRSTNLNFVPSPQNFVQATATNGWVDADYHSPAVYYKVTATDYSANESAPASPGMVTAVQGPGVPSEMALYSNVPNPFNPITVIRYAVPAGGRDVSLRIYDVNGRIVKTLARGFQPAGEKSVTWNGLDDEGQSVASGIYFYRLIAPGFSKTHKMMLMK